MILDKKLLKTQKSGKQIFAFLIKCDSCGKEEWLPGSKCRFGERKFCSIKCINTNRWHTEEWKIKISIRNSGTNNPFYGMKHSDDSKKYMSIAQKRVGGVFNVMKNKLTIPEYDIWYKKYCESVSGENNAFYGKHHSEITRQHLSEIKAKLISEGKIDIKPSHYGLKGYYVSAKSGEKFRYDSLIELLRMVILDKDINVISWTKRHSIRISYNLDGSVKKYIPDFLIHTVTDVILEEIKGYENERKKQAKFGALRKYCDDNNLICNIKTYEDIDKLCKDIFGKRINVLRREYHKNSGILEIMSL